MNRIQDIDGQPEGVVSLGYRPYQNTVILYVMHFFFTFAARMWDMGIVLLLSDLSNNSLTLVAFSGFLTSLYIVLFMGSIGYFLDNSNRLNAARYALSIKFVAVATSYSLCAYLSNYKENEFEKTQFLNFANVLYSIPFISALANLSFATVSTSVEKDWIVVLANGDSRWLSITNSRMTQIDSACNAFAPVLTGLLFVQFSTSMVSIILLVTNACSTVLLYIFMHHLYGSWNSLAVRSSKLSNSSKSKSNERSSLIPKEGLRAHETVTMTEESMFYDFLHSGCAGTMISYAFLYLTVLNFGSLMVVYLRWCQVSDGWIGAARGAGAFTGLMGATFFPYISDCIGIYRTSNLSIFSQFVLVLVACASFFFIQNALGTYGIQVLCVSVLLSRTGLWMFDLGVRQIAQETIPEYCRGRVNGQWKSMTSFFEMCSYIAGAIVSDPSYFWILAVLSASMVGIATVTFTVTRPDLYDCRRNSRIDLI